MNIDGAPRRLAVRLESDAKIRQSAELNGLTLARKMAIHITECLKRYHAQRAQRGRSSTRYQLHNRAAT